jgi:fused signal recognition particle receptor
MSEDPRPRKKSLWKILNTPVQDLFKDEGWQDNVHPAVTAPPVEQTPEQTPAAEPLAPPLAPAPPEPEPITLATPTETEAPPSQTSLAVTEPETTAPLSDADTVAHGETEEGNWLKNFTGMFWLGLGKAETHAPQQEKQSWLARFRARLGKSRGQLLENLNRLTKGRTRVDEEMLEELEEILLQSDVGLSTTDRILAHLRSEAKKRRFLPEEVVPSLMQYLQQELQSEPFRIQEGRLNILLVVGVNGTGKTTTVGKIAAKLKISGYKVMLAAADTFRAAAIEQLGVWGTRTGCPVIRHHEGADAAAVVFDAIQSARARKADVLLIDTAGRLHNKDHLMDELKKVHRIIEREKADAHLENLLVLDATTGQNGLRQAEVFSQSVPLTGLVLTKLDGTAKGGVIFSIRQELNIPIRLVGVGEQLEDLQEFEPQAFVDALLAAGDESEILLKD